MNIVDSNLLQASGLHQALAEARRTLLPGLRGGRARDINDPSAPQSVTFGADRIDAALPAPAGQRGLPMAQLHEIHAGTTDDRSSAAAFALLLAARVRRDAAALPIMWVSDSHMAARQGRLYPPGLVELGLDPDLIVHVDAPDSVAVLRAAADGVRSAAVSAVIAELGGPKPQGLDLTATRRLSLAAQKSGSMTLLLRSQANPDAPLPTAAYSRWRVNAAPSRPLAANAAGQPSFDVTLDRHRRGLTGLTARLEWNRDTRSFQEAPDLGDRPAVPGIGTDHETVARRA